MGANSRNGHKIVACQHADQSDEYYILHTTYYILVGLSVARVKRPVCWITPSTYPRREATWAALGYGRGIDRERRLHQTPPTDVGGRSLALELYATGPAKASMDGSIASSLLLSSDSSRLTATWMKPVPPSRRASSRQTMSKSRSARSHPASVQRMEPGATRGLAPEVSTQIMREDAVNRLLPRCGPASLAPSRYHTVRVIGRKLA